MDHFGRPPKGATHLQLRRVHADGSHDRLILSEGGFEQDKFPLERVSADWVRRTFGAGHYRGNWFARVEGRWKALGQMQELRMSSSTGADVRAAEARDRARGRNLRTVGFPFPLPPLADAGREQESPAIVNARVRAEREIADMRLRTMAELEKIRADGMREEHRLEMKRLESKLDELVRRRRDDDDDDDRDDPEEPDAPEGPWDFLRPLVQQAAPFIEQAIPALFAKLIGAPPPPLPEAKKG